MSPQKIALNVKESLEAKELLRQRHSSNGTVENLVRWRLYGPEKRSSSTSEESSTSGSLSEESKVGKDVFLWMTNHELMVCSPHLYNTDATSSDPGLASNLDESKLDEDGIDASSDVEDLDDMRHDVIKLVNRAKKQMHRMKKEGTTKPLTSLSHTTKVLSTYAGLGSLANVFRETGALDLILELLWTNDVETRRAAGRMLRALALHDAGSRAYVLLSLTQDQQDERSNDHKQHYADFENRAMVMEMFAETASGEEAHAVALDSVQLPQVPGKSLFTLMKCYLRVTSLMDGNNKGENKRNQQKLSWMRFATIQADHDAIEDFEVAMAISDLIFELNNVMDWNSKSPRNGNPISTDKHTDKGSEKSLSPPLTPTLFGTRLKEMVKAIRNTKKGSDPGTPIFLRDTSTDQSPNVQGVSRKPLFLQSARESTIDSVLLSTLLKAGEPSTSAYRQPNSFSSRRLYIDYVRSEIKPGFRVRACQSYQDVNEGDEGVYRQHNHSTPPVQVFWHRLNRTYWVYWHHIVLLGEGSSDDSTEPKTPVKFALCPEESELWPFLNGMSDKVKSLYGVRYADEDSFSKKDNADKDIISQQNWWVLLFYASRTSAERREKIKEYLLEKFPEASHMCNIKPAKDVALFIMMEILKDTSAIDKENMRASPICRLLIDGIERTEQEERAKKREAEKKEEEEIKKKGESQPDEAISSQISNPPVPLSSGAKAKEEDTKDEVSLEEKAKAAEMGMRIGLIVDEDTQKKYLDVFLDKSMYDLSSKLWKLQQESKNLLKISRYVSKSGRGTKIIALACMKALVSRETSDSSVLNERKEEMLSNILVAAEDSDSVVADLYLQVILEYLKKQPEKAEERDEFLMNLAISGHLKTLFDMIAKFQDHSSIVYDAILCTCLILQAILFAKHPPAVGDSAYMNMIVAIITSMFSATDPSQVKLIFDLDTDSETAPRSTLRAYLMAIDQLINEENDESTDNAKRSQVLYSALCVLCMVARKDQSKSLLNENDYVLHVVENGLKASLSAHVRRMLLRLKGLMISMSRTDPLEFEPGEDDFPPLDRSADEENSEVDDVLISLFKEQPVPDPDSSDKLTEHITKLKSLPADEVRSTTATVINDFILPTLKKTSSLSSECAKCVASLKLFLVEFESVAKEGNLILFESYWSVLVFFLQNILELCIATSNKSLSIEITSDIISILKSLSELDKDFVVFLCGLEAKQTISRLQEKHGTITNASELCELITSCERQRTLHNRLLAVVLGGCISTALQCIEEARRLQKQINIPLFDQLLSNLCKGADLELKEDKCYERLEVSSNTRQVSRLTDGNPKSYWESNGSSGAHWINVFMKKGIVVRKLTIAVAQEDSSYMPSRIAVFGGTTTSDVSTQLSCVNIGSTDREIVVLENARRYWPIVRISIRRCQQGGIDTRIHGLEVVGPKPSFWPLLRRQLYIRTSLIYSVQVHSWVADASVQASLAPSQVMKHKMLDVPSRLVKAIKFEQDFADEYLPNAESALVLGQACRSAFSIPILEDLLARPAGGGEGNCVLEHMLNAYILCNDKKKSDAECLIFSSKLRRLLRLVVDLDQGGGGRPQQVSSSSSSKPSKGQQEEPSITTWSKRVQPYHKRFGQSESKMSRAESTTSISAAIGATKQSTDETSNASNDDSDIYEPLSYLPQIAEQWSRTVETKLIEHFQSVVEPSALTLDIAQCLEIASAIFDKYNFFRKCSQDLFGTRSLFTITLNTAAWKAISALNFDTKRNISYVCTVILHYFISYESRGLGSPLLLRLRSSFNSLRLFLSLTSGTNFCDVFEQLYVFMLLKRISSSSGVSLDVEEKVCKLLQSCFPNQLPINLIQDVKYSKGLNSRFLSSYMERCDMMTSNSEALGSIPVEVMWRNYEAIRQDEFEVMLFRPGACSNFVGSKMLDSELVSSCNVQCGSLMKEFELFFEHDRENHTARMFSAGKRAVTFITDYGFGVLHDLKNNVDITAKIGVCLSLLLFNHEPEIAGAQLDSASLQILVDKNIIYESSPNTYRVNDVIAGDVDCLPGDADHLTSLQQLSAALEESFNKTAAIVDCAIVNTMKHEHQCTLDALVEKTIRKCMKPENNSAANGVICSASFVRSRCEHHINLGYIFRKDNPQLLIFNPDEGVQDCDDKECDATNEMVPEMSGMPSKNGDTKKFAQEFIKNVNSSDQPSSEFVEENRKDSEFVESFYKNASSPEEPGSRMPKYSDQNRQAQGYSFGDSLNGMSFSFSANMAPTTISSDNFLLELRNMILKISEVLSLDIDDVEALLLVFEWNSDKLIDSFVNDQAKTLSSIGVPDQNQSFNPERRLSESGEELCPICMIHITSPTLDVPYCKHVCCIDCWQTYLTTKLDQDMACTTTCPIGSCKTKITTKLFHAAFNDDPPKRRKYDLSLVRSYVESDRSYSWCHNPKGCDFIIRMSKDGRDEGWCTDCGWQTCFTCTYVEAHYPASCSHMSQWMDDGGYYEGMNEDAQSKHLARLIAKRCPNCQANIEKNDGCLHMKCIKCSHDFCWRCLQPWRPTHRDYYNCSSKVSKLAQSNIKFVEFNKRCQHHNMAKSFAFATRDRLLTLTSSQDPEQLRYSMDLCTKLAHCRRILAYCNVFNFYTTDTDRLNNIGLHSAVLENKTLLLQEHVSEVLLRNADIQFLVSQISEDIMSKGRALINQCDSSIRSIVEFSKQGMKIALPSSGSQISMTEAGTMLLQTEGETDVQMALNARPAGMSDDDDNDDLTENTQSDNNESDDDDMDDDEDVNMYSSEDDDDDDDNDMHYDSGGGGLMDFDSDNDNILPHSDSDDFSIFD